MVRNLSFQRSPLLQIKHFISRGLTDKGERVDLVNLWASGGGLLNDAVHGGLFGGGDLNTGRFKGGDVNRGGLKVGDLKVGFKVGNWERGLSKGGDLRKGGLEGVSLEEEASVVGNVNVTTLVASPRG